MVTLRYKTATKFSVIFILAVFFSLPARGADSSLLSLESSLSDLIYRLSRSVVTVEASRRMPVGGSVATTEEAVRSTVASGIICDTCGHVLVAARSVADHDRVLVTFDNRVVPARVRAIDYQSEMALLECSPLGGQPAEFSDLQTCAGQMVVAIGNAHGIRSAPSLGFCAGVRDDGMMQFSLPVISGAVGGGIFDFGGHLIGIIVGGLGDDREVTLALPAYRVPGIVEFLLTYGDRKAGFIGVTTREIEITPAVHIDGIYGSADSLGLTIERGVIVTSVVPLSPAHRFGLSVGDLIFAFDDVAVNSAVGLASLIRRSRPHSSVRVELLRHNKPLALPVEVGSLENWSGLNRQVRTLEQDSDYGRYVDSLKHSLDQLRDEISRIERRLYRLD